MKAKIESMEEKHEINITRCWVDCPICKNRIRGNSEGMVIYNFGVHFKQKHPGKTMGKYLFEESKSRENKK